MSGHRWARDNETNARFYGDLVRRHGIDVRSLDWGSRESQVKRFAVLAEIGNLKGASVLDVGCGLGDFYAWMKRKKLRPEYTGLDITPEMVGRAGERFPGVRFCLCDLLDLSHGVVSHDYVLSSGIFTHRCTSPYDFLMAMVRRMFEISKHAVGFNCLSAWAEEKEGHEFHADPVRILSLCRTLTSRVVLRHDYHPRDFTIYMYKTART